VDLAAALLAVVEQEVVGKVITIYKSSN